MTKETIASRHAGLAELRGATTREMFMEMPDIATPCAIIFWKVETRAVVLDSMVERGSNRPPSWASVMLALGFIAR